MTQTNHFTNLWRELSKCCHFPKFLIDIIHLVLSVSLLFLYYTLQCVMCYMYKWMGCCCLSETYKKKKSKREKSLHCGSVCHTDVRGSRPRLGSIACDHPTPPRLYIPVSFSFLSLCVCVCVYSQHIASPHRYIISHLTPLPTSFFVSVTRDMSTCKCKYMQSENLWKC